MKGEETKIMLHTVTVLNCNWHFLALIVLLMGLTEVVAAHASDENGRVSEKKTLLLLDAGSSSDTTSPYEEKKVSRGNTDTTSPSSTGDNKMLHPNAETLTKFQEYLADYRMSQYSVYNGKTFPRKSRKNAKGDTGENEEKKVGSSRSKNTGKTRRQQQQQQSTASEESDTGKLVGNRKITSSKVRLTTTREFSSLYKICYDDAKRVCGDPNPFTETSCLFFHRGAISEKCATAISGKINCFSQMAAKELCNAHQPHKKHPSFMRCLHQIAKDMEEAQEGEKGEVSKRTAAAVSPHQLSHLCTDTDFFKYVQQGVHAEDLGQELEYNWKLEHGGNTKVYNK